MKVRKLQPRILFVVGAGVVAACVGVAASGTTTPTAVHAEPVRSPVPAAGSPDAVPASCRAPVRGERIWVDLGRVSLEHFEAAAHRSKEILRVATGGVCAFIDRTDARALRDALRQRDYEIPVVAFTHEKLETADVRIAPKAGAPGAAWRLSFGLAEDGVSWRIVGAAPEE